MKQAEESSSFTVEQYQELKREEVAVKEAKGVRIAEI